MAQSQYTGFDREASIYSIYNIEIDETSRNVTTARDRAIMNGQRKALERLFRRIILTSDREKLPRFEDSEVVEFVSGFEVNNERRSTVRYIASLIVHFNRDKVNDVLSQYQIPYAETLGTAVSILPVLEEAGALMLWEKGNNWRVAWENHDVINNLVPINTPEPSLKNRMYISALQAKIDDQNAIRSFIEKNTLNDLIVATATVRKDVLDEKYILDINLKRNNIVEDDQDDIEAEKTISVSVPLTEEPETVILENLFAVGVVEATDWVDDLWKSKVLVNYGNSSKLLASGALTQVDDWLTIQTQLAKVNLIKTVNLKNMSINNVDLEIEYAGDTEQLALSLAQQGLLLQQNENSGLWAIETTNFALERSGIQ